jgi:lipopolysaccharide assembly outer membrane protein LptD (OstA)
MLWYNIDNKEGNMKNFVVAFEKNNGRQGQRAIRARNEAEAIIKCRSVVANSFWHFVKEVK